MAFKMMSEMNRKIQKIFVLLAFLLLGMQFVNAQKVFVLELRDEVGASMARYVDRGFAAAVEQKAELIILHLDTYGGRIDYADSVRADILNSEIPTAVLIDRNAGSAGALISIACDSIYMVPAASIGAATVVDGNTGEAAIDKYQSYWRAVMRATAEAKGRDPKIAEKMVDEKLEIPGLSPVGQVITFTNSDAIENGYCEGTKKNIDEVIAAFGIKSPQVVNYEGSTVDKAINFLLIPAVSSVMLILIFGGVFMEMKTPGFGVSGVVALVASFFFFGSHYATGLAESWEIGIFMLGVILIALELFVIPGFGVAGVLGILFAVTGAAAALLGNNGVSFEYVSVGDLLSSIALVLVMLSTAILIVIWLAKYVVTNSRAYPFVDGGSQESSAGFTVVSQEILHLVGEIGETSTDLRPIGFVMINGKQFDATAKESFIAKGERILVEKISGINLVVTKVAST